MTKIIDAKGNVTKLGYDKKGRLTRITNPLNQKQDFKYDSTDNLIKRFDALGNLVMSLKYDSLNNPT